MANKTIQVNKCEIFKEGTTNGNDWVIYKVTCSGDNEMKEFKTFNSDYVNAEGQQMNGNFEYNQKYKNWSEISVKKAEENSQHDEIMKGLQENQRLLNTINAKVSGVGDVLNMPEKEEIPLPPEPQEEPEDKLNVPF